MSLPLFKVHVDVDAALAAVRAVLESGFINEGEQVGRFTAALRTALDCERLFAVNSGTSALTLALRLAGVRPGDEVVSTAMTCVATNTPIVNLGARVVWADVDPDSGLIDPQEVARRITARTRAVMCVAWAGTPCDLDALRGVCRDAGVPLIQDAAHAFGARYRGAGVANHADFTCYSFQAIKHVTCGDGGALACRDEAAFDLGRKLKWFGYDRDQVKDAKGNWKGQGWSVDIGPGEVGYKFNMNNLAAAVGLSQVPHFERLVAAHRRNAALYDAAFAGMPGLRPATRPEGAESSFWVYTLMLDGSAERRDALLAHLNAEGIGAGLVHLPNDDYSCFAESRTELPGVRSFAARQISLPCGWWMGEDEVARVVERVGALAA